MKNNRLAISAIDWLLLSMVIMGVLLVILSHRAKRNVEYITTTDTVTLTDSITNWKYDTVYFSRLDTVKLPVVQTDTVQIADSVYVTVPLSVYHYDTIISDSAHTSRIQAVVSGFSVSLDTLSIQTELMPQSTKKQPWYNNLCPAVGVGLGTGGVGVFVGVGYKIF